MEVSCVNVFITAVSSFEALQLQVHLSASTVDSEVLARLAEVLKFACMAVNGGSARSAVARRQQKADIKAHRPHRAEVIKKSNKL